MLVMRIEDAQIVLENADGVEFVSRRDGSVVVRAEDGVSIEMPRLSRANAPQEHKPSPVPKERPRLAVESGARGSQRVDVKAVPGLASYEYLAALLEEAGHPLSLEELEHELVKRTAFESESENLRNTLRTAMVRKPETFQQASRTHWGLTKWAEPTGASKWPDGGNGSSERTLHKGTAGSDHDSSTLAPRNSGATAGASESETGGAE